MLSKRFPTAILAIVLAAFPVAAEDGAETADEEIEYPELPEILSEGDGGADDDSSLIPELELGAYLETDLRHRTEPPESFTYNTNDLGLEVRTVWDSADAQAELRLRGTGFTTAGDLDDLTVGEALQPWELELRSAYANLYGLPLAPLDISLGLQEVGWGVGDEIRVINEVNPGDYRDPFAFGEKLGQNMLRLTAWFGPTWRLEGLIVPTFTPARLPADTSLVMPEFTLPEGLWLSELNVSVETPQASLAESAQYGLRLKGGLGPVDLELAYHYGRDYLPVPTRVTLIPTLDPEAPFGVIPVIANAAGTFPRRHLVGGSFAADIADIGFWGELGAVIHPEEITQTVETILGDETTTLYPAGEYFKWLGGVDYSFGGFYVQLQYLHGLYTERGAHELSDVFVLGVEKGLFYDALTLRLAAGYEVPDFAETDEHWGTLVNPEIDYRPIDQLTFTLGGRLIEGEGASTFALLEREDVVYLKLRVDL